MLMVRRDGAEIRKERIQEIIKRIMSLLYDKEELELDSMVAMLEYETGLRPEKILEYLKVGEKLKRFEIDTDNDKIIRVKISE